MKDGRIRLINSLPHPSLPQSPASRLLSSPDNEREKGREGGRGTVGSESSMKNNDNSFHKSSLQYTLSYCTTIRHKNIPFLLYSLLQSPSFGLWYCEKKAIVGRGLLWKAIARTVGGGGGFYGGTWGRPTGPASTPLHFRESQEPDWHASAACMLEREEAYRIFCATLRTAQYSLLES